MQQQIAGLIQQGHAYAAEGHVLFDTQSYGNYGKLSGRPLDEMIAGARVEVAPYKKDVTDFVLWKPSKEGEPGWPSPCGIKTPGRPGWHIECSAMSWKHLGETFDIHGGGIDLVFPHHENEIAQSRCAFHTGVMANYWMHNGFLQVEGEKMSKSLGNFVTIHELLKDWPGEVVRLNMLRTHYRQPMDWTVKGLEESWKILASWTDGPEFSASKDEKIAQPVLNALCDDLNTPQMIAALHSLSDKSQLAASLRALGFTQRPESKRQIDSGKVESLIAARNDARKSKNFKESDRIRDELAAMGVVIKDSKDGTSWEIAR
jgi:cysteinyl-tRNA synthetase